MGRIKTTLTKRIALKLMKEYGDRFKEDFQSNKKIVDELTDITLKKMRNIIAGYISRLKRTERKL